MLSHACGPRRGATGEREADLLQTGVDGRSLVTGGMKGRREAGGGTVSSPDAWRKERGSNQCRVRSAGVPVAALFIAALNRSSALLGDLLDEKGRLTGRAGFVDGSVP